MRDFAPIFSTLDSTLDSTLGARFGTCAVARSGSVVACHPLSVLHHMKGGLLVVSKNQEKMHATRSGLS
jgi:hypothetical protein